MKTPLAIAGTAAALILALVAAGCGGSQSSAGSTGAPAPGGAYGAPAPTTTEAASTSAAMVAVAKTSLGRILVDGRGMTLYLFEKDTGPKSTCDGACASTWPPLTTQGAPKAGGGVMTAKLGTSKRSDGTTQVTYDGHPLYGYVTDQAPGDTTGQGLDFFGGEWYVLSPQGAAVTTAA